VGIAALVGATLLVTGCGSGGATPVIQTPTPTPTVNAAHAFCGKLLDEVSAYASFILDSASGSVDVPEARRLIIWADDLEAVTPSDANAGVKDLLEPLRSIEDVIAAGGGSLNFSTAAYKAANLSLVDYCAEAGYSAG
jgi:hypothetical protein